jgi:hypothetical protein
MHQDLIDLLALQDADREIARLTEEIAALPRRVAAIEEQLADARTRVEKANAAIKGHDAERRRLEGQIQAEQQKISKYRDQSLAVKTNEQYKALLHEIQFAEKDIRACEDKILDTMVATEEQEKAQKQAEADLKAETIEIEKEKAETRARTEVDQRELAEWNAKRNTLRAGISSASLEHYDRVLKHRRPALAEVIAQKCSVCNVMLRPQKYNEVRTNEQVMTCDSCSRILFFDPAREAQAAEGTAPPKEAVQPTA